MKVSEWCGMTQNCSLYFVHKLYLSDINNYAEIRLKPITLGVNANTDIAADLRPALASNLGIGP